MKIFTTIILFIAAPLITSGCAGNRARVDSYTDPSFDQRSIKSVAILPMRNSQISYSDAISINRAIQQELKKHRPDLKLVGSDDSVNIINDNYLADDYSRFLLSYYTSGIPNSQVLKKIGTALGVDVIIQGGIINVYQSDGNGWNKVGGAKVTIKYGMIATSNSQIVWDATAECQAWTATEYEQAPSVMTTVGPAINKIFSGFPLAKLDKVLPQYESPAKEPIEQSGKPRGALR